MAIGERPYYVELPVSKSIANRRLVLQALHGDEFSPFPVQGFCAEALPDDVRIMHNALRQLQALRRSPSRTPLTLDVDNCGTAMRFLTAYCAQLDGCEVTLTGCERMRHRPIGQLVEALRLCQADIAYLGEEGFPPLQIHGRRLTPVPIAIPHPLSTQFVSALLLVGLDVTTSISSPYITMTRTMVQACALPQAIEADWSAAAFWYEYVALHPTVHIAFATSPAALSRHSLQGDKVVADIFAALGVQTVECDGTIHLTHTPTPLPPRLVQDFAACPDLYPAVAIACEQLGMPLVATGTESLRLKESDRLQAVAMHRTCRDHRIAMALLAADLPCDDLDCVRKSYPAFVQQLRSLPSPAAPCP